MKTIFWLVGDHSGDVHAAQVLEKYQQKFPAAKHWGIGGSAMQKYGFESLYPFHKFMIMGFMEVLCHLPFIMEVEKAIARAFQTHPPDLVVLVDYPGFNMRIARLAHGLGLKVLYYIVPQFWAWKYHRIFLLKKYCCFLACIFPFEKAILDRHSIPCSYVGHPMLEEIVFHVTREEFSQQYNLDPQKKWIGFFPGSRDIEVKRLLPIFVQSIEAMYQLGWDYEFLISRAENLPEDLFTPYIIPKRRACSSRRGRSSFSSCSIKLIDGYHNYALMKYADFLVVKSGTSTMEAAFIGTPFCIVYQTNRLTYHLAKKMIKLQMIGMPNIILGKKLIQELIQEAVNSINIMQLIDLYLHNEKEYSTLATELAAFRAMFSGVSAAHNVVSIMENLLR